MNRSAVTLLLFTFLTNAHVQANDAELKLNQIQVIGTHNSYHAGIAPNETKLWQANYAEYISVPTLWPAFSVEDYHGALKEFQGRERRFGGL